MGVGRERFRGVNDCPLGEGEKERDLERRRSREVYQRRSWQTARAVARVV